LSLLGSYAGEDVVRVFQEAGWRIARRKGSHVILIKEGYRTTLSIPVHKGKSLKRGTLRDLIHDAGMTVDEFIGHL
jgi:predicted RNA binding protein YcfA (HicA-like mRNA interferase family)